MEPKNKKSVHEYMQYTTFEIDGYLYGIDVKKVQEIVKPMTITEVPLAEQYVKGLLNLRGQVATAIELRNLLNAGGQSPEDSMNVVCRTDQNLVSFLVDKIGDVIEVPKSSLEETPHTIPTSTRDLLAGVIKTNETLLSIVDVDKIMQRLAA